MRPRIINEIKEEDLWVTFESFGKYSVPNHQGVIISYRPRLFDNKEKIIIFDGRKDEKLLVSEMLLYSEGTHKMTKSILHWPEYRTIWKPYLDEYNAMAKRSRIPLLRTRCGCERKWSIALYDGNNFGDIQIPMIEPMPTRPITDEESMWLTEAIIKNRVFSFKGRYSDEGYPIFMEQPA